MVVGLIAGLLLLFSDRAFVVENRNNVFVGVALPSATPNPDTVVLAYSGTTANTYEANYYAGGHIAEVGDDLARRSVHSGRLDF